MCYARRQRLSWARIKLSKYVIYTKVSLETYQSWFCSSYFKELVVSLLQFKNSKEFSESLFVLLFNFQGASCLRSRERQPCYYITLFSSCQYLFKTFLKFFLQVFHSVFSKCLSCDSLSSISLREPLVKTFLKLFQSFSQALYSVPSWLSPWQLC